MLKKTPQLDRSLDMSLMKPVARIVKSRSHIDAKGAMSKTFSPMKEAAQIVEIICRPFVLAANFILNSVT